MLQNNLTSSGRKIALVTGGTRGIGQAAAIELSSSGNNFVIITGRSQAGAEETLRRMKEIGGDGLFLPCNLEDTASINHLMKDIENRFQRLDILVNNAGISNTHQMDEISEAEWDLMMAVNLKAPFFLCLHAIRIMRKNHYGRIVNLASIAGERGAFYSGLHYTASKGGILALTKGLALQTAQDGICINCVSPGTADTPMSRAEGIPSDGIPIGRAATPEEVAHAICFLASEDAGYITGATLDVNGGQFMH